MWQNDLTNQLGIQYPIIQAPMAGGPTTSKLVAAVSNEGGLGTIGAGYLSPSQIRQQIQEVKQLTEKNFGINLFVPSNYQQDEQKIMTAKELLQPIEQELKVDSTVKIPTYEQDLETFHEQIQVVVEEQVPVCSFTFGVPSQEIIDHLKKNSIIVIGTATTVQEAILNEQAGMDMVVLQGSEAGGHRGTFENNAEQGLIGLMSLIPQAADQINLPIIAAGGIMDARGAIAAKCLGAQAVQMGTAFLVCEESGASQVHKETIIKASEDQVVLTKAFSGKMARGVNNRFIETMKINEHILPPYPIQNELTKGIRKASSTSRNPEFMSLWAGQSPRLAKASTVQELINQLIKDTEVLKKRLSF
ncbi:nitronate monooxygenase [Bacillus salipaludis]|uniref:Probable nitronate monooxygenase n=1 Tax=Bacillus salipaludis TaxID=2547811 RepID=A0A4R5VMK5_9BACI|nr:nitronate monooxygenase [Bacillus salipaludis]MDQ6598346.1 nitronate monooxygenase [Bacillus salipaludis]TDK59293.1 nitronate monooxygenase [Bacillus salipaludis]